MCSFRSTLFPVYVTLHAVAERVVRSQCLELDASSKDCRFIPAWFSCQPVHIGLQSIRRCNLLFIVDISNLWRASTFDGRFWWKCRLVQGKMAVYLLCNTLAAKHRFVSGVFEESNERNGLANNRENNGRVQQWYTKRHLKCVPFSCQRSFYPFLNWFINLSVRLFPIYTCCSW